jgi:hypothetical protein
MQGMVFTEEYIKNNINLKEMVMKFSGDGALSGALIKKIKLLYEFPKVETSMYYHNYYVSLWLGIDRLKENIYILEIEDEDGSEYITFDSVSELLQKKDKLFKVFFDDKKELELVLKYLKNNLKESYKVETMGD